LLLLLCVAQVCEFRSEIIAADTNSSVASHLHVVTSSQRQKVLQQPGWWRGASSSSGLCRL
jgi:hypothetical protein